MASSEAQVSGVRSECSADRGATHPYVSSPRLSRKTQEEVVAENDTSSCEDPDNFPLHSTWSFWFDRSQRGGNAGDFFANLRCLSAVTSIKAFWRVFNNLPSCNKLNERESYHLMRDEKRRPVWEDADNASGGMWVMKVDKQYTVRTWQELLLAAIGEQFSESVHPDDEICGISVRIRYDHDVFQIWNKDSNLSSHATVLDRVKQLVPSLEIKSFYYSSNQEKMRDSLCKPASGHRGVSPPPPMMMGHRYPGPHTPFQSTPRQFHHSAMPTYRASSATRLRAPQGPLPPPYTPPHP